MPRLTIASLHNRLESANAELATLTAELAAAQNATITPLYDRCIVWSSAGGTSFGGKSEAQSGHRYATLYNTVTRKYAGNIKVGEDVGEYQARIKLAQRLRRLERQCNRTSAAVAKWESAIAAHPASGNRDAICAPTVELAELAERAIAEARAILKPLHIVTSSARMACSEADEAIEAVTNAFANPFTAESLRKVNDCDLGVGGAGWITESAHGDRTFWPYVEFGLRLLHAGDLVTAEVNRRARIRYNFVSRLVRHAARHCAYNDPAAIIYNNGDEANATLSVMARLATNNGAGNEEYGGVGVEFFEYNVAHYEDYDHPTPYAIAEAVAMWCDVGTLVNCCRGRAINREGLTLYEGAR